METFGDLIDSTGNVAEPTSAPEVKTETSQKDSNLDQKNQGYETSSDNTIETFDNLDLNSDVNKLPVQEGNSEDSKKDSKEDETKEEPKGGEKDEESEESGEEKTKPEEKPSEEKSSKKMAKAFADGKPIDVPKDAEFLTKVNGKREKVTLQELQDNYAGKQAWDVKISEANNRVKEAEQREATVTQAQEELRGVLTDIRQGILDGLENKSNPMDAVSKIVDILGVDSYDFNKAVFESFFEDFQMLGNMSEPEREAYFSEKRINHLENQRKSFEENQRNQQAQQELIRKVDQMREAHGVSEEEFVSAFNELRQHYPEVTHEQAVQYAANLPHLTKAQETMEAYKDSLSDDEFDEFTARVANAYKSGQYSEKDIQDFLAEQFQVDSLVDEINERADFKGTSGAQKELKKQNISQQDYYTNSVNDDQINW